MKRKQPTYEQLVKMIVKSIKSDAKKMELDVRVAAECYLDGLKDDINVELGKEKHEDRYSPRWLLHLPRRHRAW